MNRRQFAPRSGSRRGVAGRDCEVLRRPPIRGDQFQIGAIRVDSITGRLVKSVDRGEVLRERTCAASISVKRRDHAASVKRTHSKLTVPAAARSAGLRESLQNGTKALIAANVGSCTSTLPPGAAAVGCQSRHMNVDVTTAQFAGRMIGPSGVSGPSGDVTGIGGAAIVRWKVSTR